MIYRGYDIIWHEDTKMWRVFLYNELLESFHTTELAQDWIDAKKRREAQREAE